MAVASEAVFLIIKASPGKSCGAKTYSRTSYSAIGHWRNSAYKKTRGAEARLGYLEHLLTENSNALIVEVGLTQASGTAERESALAMLAYKPASESVSEPTAATTRAALSRRHGSWR